MQHSWTPTNVFIACVLCKECNEYKKNSFETKTIKKHLHGEIEGEDIKKNSAHAVMHMGVHKTGTTVRAQ